MMIDRTECLGLLRFGTSFIVMLHEPALKYNIQTEQNVTGHFSHSSDSSYHTNWQIKLQNGRVFMPVVKNLIHNQQTLMTISNYFKFWQIGLLMFMNLYNLISIMFLCPTDGWV